jgi:hypothetical protein
MAVYEALLLNTVVPQIQAAQAGDSYVMVVNATTPALRITQTGTGDSILVEDAANPDSSPFVVTAAGDVGIGTTAIRAKLVVNEYTNTSYTELVAFTGAKGLFVGIPTNQLAIVDSTAQAAGVGGEISFEGKYNSTDITSFAAVGGVKENSTSNDYGGAFIVKTRLNGGNLLERARIDASGNLGLGVTPNANWSTVTALQIKNAAFAGFANSAYMVANAYYDGSVFKYIAAAAANRYQMAGGQHEWYTSTSTPVIGNDTAMSQAMTLDASGNLLIGRTTQWDGEELGITGSASSMRFLYARSTSAGHYLSLGTNGTAPYIEYGNGAGLIFKDGASERARITSGGYFKASDSGVYNNPTGTYHELRNTANNDCVIVESTNASFSNVSLNIIAARNTTNGSFAAIQYYNSGAAAPKFVVADSGNVTNTNGTYGTISDQKMKTDIVDAGSQWSDIKALRFRKFKMKDDPSGLVQLGVVAQEVELTSPGLVDEHQDRDAEGNDLGTTTKSVKTSVLLMKAAVALQEAMARIETLEAKIAALEAK